MFKILSKSSSTRKFTSLLVPKATELKDLDHGENRVIHEKYNRYANGVLLLSIERWIGD